MNLQEIVPPLDLCKQIPKGEFKDSFFCYVWCSFREEYIICKSDWEHTQDFCCPAPTLQEILEDLPRDFEFSRCYEDNVPTEKYITIIGTEIGEVGNNGAESAMKTWLNIKGIETK